MKILLVGDVMLGRLVNETLKTKSSKYPWGDTLPIFKDADLRICNLECVISDIGEPFPREKVFHFRTDEKNIETLLAVKINMVSCANNHALDFGYEALLRMIKVLEEHGINYAGIGINSYEAKKPAIYRVGSQKVGLIAFTDNQPDWEAKKDKPGLFYVPINEKDKRAQYLFKLIQKTRDDVNILIVSTHWGPNWGYRPPNEHVSFAHYLIEAGVDIVFGHSPHVFRGIEVYKHKVILYSAGDFIDDYAVDEIERNDESFIFVLEIEKNTLNRLSLYPTVIKNFQATLADYRRQEAIVSKMQYLCKQFNTQTYWNEKAQRLEVLI